MLRDLGEPPVRRCVLHILLARVRWINKLTLQNRTSGVTIFNFSKTDAILQLLECEWCTDLEYLSCTKEIEKDGQIKIIKYAELSN